MYLLTIIGLTVPFEIKTVIQSQLKKKKQDEASDWPSH